MTPLTLPPLPTHVFLPTEEEMDQARRLSGGSMPSRSWRQKTCPVCNGTRLFTCWKGEPVITPPVTYVCPCEDQMVLERWMGVRGIDARYRKYRIIDATGLNSPTLVWLMSWLEDPAARIRYGEGALLSGKPGSGKTLVSTLVMKRALQVGVTCRFLNAGTMALLNNWSQQEFRTFWETKIRSCQLLVLDNLGTEGPVVKQTHEIDQMLRSRTANGLSTFITTTLSTDEIQGAYGDTVMRSILDVSEVVAGISRESAFDHLSVQRAEQSLGIMRATTFGS